MQNVEEVYKQYSSDIYKYLFCLTGNKDLSEDLTQETFAIAVKKINKFKGECKISVWLCQIAKHLWYKELKKEKRQPNVSIEELSQEIETLDSTEEIICKKEEKVNFFKSIQKLDEKSKEVIYLRIFGNLSFIEIGEILGKTPNWARVTFYRGKQKMKEEKDNDQ